MNSRHGTEQTKDFVRLLTNHQGILQNFIISLMPGHSDVADVLQETNLTMWEKLHEFEPGTNFRAWAFTIARFKVMSCLKKSANRNYLPFDGDLLDTIERKALEQDSAVNDSKIRALSGCMGRLRKQDAELLRARYESAESVESYAERIGRPVGSLYVILGRLRDKLKRCVELEINKEEYS